MVSAALVLACGVLASGQQATFRSGTRVVSVPVSVTRGGNAVTDLRRSDFVVLDNGVRQDITEFSSEARAIDFTVVLSEGLTSEKDQFLLSTKAVAHLQDQLRPSDRFRLIRFGETVDDAALLGEAGDAPAALLSPVGHTLYDIQLRPRLATMDALFQAFALPADPSRRQVILAFTEGFDSWSTLPCSILPTIAGHSDAILHVALLQSPPPPPTGSAAGDRWTSPDGTQRFYRPDVGRWRECFGAIDAAVRTTGGALHHIGEGPTMIDDFLRDVRVSYLLRYVPHGAPNAGWHELTIALTEPRGAVIRARRGYFGG